MKSEIFSSETYLKIAETVKGFLNSQADYLSANTIDDPRAVGGAIQSLLESEFDKLLGETCTEYSANFARRAMADLAFKDSQDFYYIVDVKTHRTDTKFNMPNLTSVERLARFYEDDLNYFVLLLVSYHIEETKVIVTSVNFVPIEFLDWECLTIGALGIGQIQIANSNKVKINSDYPRKKWMLEFCEVMLQFYPKEISKIGTRITYFEKVKEFWLDKK
jgi:hypothetical protein